jgi:chorismate dehydratase
VRSIAIDDRSRTSVALLRLLCLEHYRIQPDYVPMEPDVATMLREHDAALIIGDASLYCDHPAVEKRDLASDWREFTSYPFVFAFIAGKPGAVGPEQVLLFQRSLHQGLLNVRKIAENHPCPLHPNMADLNERYLTEMLNFSFGERELNGLKLFYIKAWENGLIDGVPRIRFYES